MNSNGIAKHLIKKEPSSSRYSRTTTESSLRLGLGEYERKDNEGASISLQELRSLFLFTASKAKSELAADLENLLGLYSQIPLFCYTADKKRRNTRNGAKRYLWNSHCRPKWKYIENRWLEYLKKIAMSPAEKVRFELQFDDYYDVHHRDGIWSSAFNVPAHTDDKIAQFIRKVFEWSNKYLLNATWCREHAYQTLDLWSQSEVYKKARIWSYTTAHVSSSRVEKRSKLVMFMRRPFEPLPQELVFIRTTLYPVQGFRAQEKKQTTEEFRRELDAFLDRCEQKAQDANMVRSIRKATRKHLKWLADFQVKEINYNEISHDASKSRGPKSSSMKSYLSDDTKKVRKAINDLARLIELPLRQEPRRPGRRRKS